MLKKNYYCCICHTKIIRNNRLLYQKFDGKKTYGAFHNKCVYDFCDKHFKIFNNWIIKNKKEEF